MNNSHHFRIGFQQFANRCPESLKPGRESFEWYVQECKRLDCHSLSMMMVEKIPEEEKYDGGFLEYHDMGYVREMAALAREADIHYVLYCGVLFSLAGLDHPVTGKSELKSPQEVHRYMDRLLEICEIFGIDTLGGGYGRMPVKFSRYNKQTTVEEIQRYIVANLKALGCYLEGTDIMMAYENHMDLSGKQLARVLEEVDHPNIAAMYDVGNAATLWCDPMEDVDFLAPWAIAAHFKDFKMVDNPVFEHLWQDMPRLLKGCCLGEGFLDFDVIMETICSKAKRLENMILMAEPAFILPDKPYSCLEEMHQFDRECTYQFVEYLKDLVKKY